MKLAAVSVLALSGVLLGVPTATAASTDDYLQLSWDGSTFVTSTNESFVGTTNKIAPGAERSRTITVRNNSPEPAVLTGWIMGETLPTTVKDLCPGREGSNLDWLGSTATCPKLGDQGSFYDDLQAKWSGGLGTGNTNFTTLAAKREVTIGQKTLKPSETVRVQAGFLLPEEAISGNWANANQREAKFDVLFELKGTTEPVTPVTPQPQSTYTPPSTTPGPIVTITKPHPTTPGEVPAPKQEERVSRNGVHYARISALPEPTPPNSSTPAPEEKSLKNCSELGENIQATDGRYDVRLDNDKNGIACERDNPNAIVDSGRIYRENKSAITLIGGGVVLLGLLMAYRARKARNQ